MVQCVLSYSPSGGDEANWTSLKADLDHIEDCVNNIDTINLNDDQVTTGKVADDAIDANKLADDSVLEAHIDWSTANAGVEAWRTGPDAVGANAGRIARVSSAFTTATAATQTISVTFASDCEDGDPAFAAAPIAMGMPVFISPTAVDNNMPTQTYFTAMASTGCTVKVVYAASTATGVAATMDFCVAGPV